MVSINSIVIPILITIGLILWAFIWGNGKDKRSGVYVMHGISIVFALVPALVISLLSWIIWGILK